MLSPPYLKPSCFELRLPSFNRGPQTLNGALRGLSRTLVPLGGAVADSYAHDPYGLSAQSTVMPGLYELPRLNASPASSDERYLLATELIRQRNRFADGMREVRDLTERALAAVDR
jgi:hypothetical protein